MARILLMLLFIISGWGKLTNFTGTAAYLGGLGLPFAEVAAAVAILVETVASVAVMVGFATRPLAIFLAVYTVVTAVIGHHYWTMEGAAKVGNTIHFFKNISICGGFLLLYVTGAGRRSLDSRLDKN